MHAKDGKRGCGASEPIRDRKSSGGGLPVVSTPAGSVQSTEGQIVQPNDRRSGLGPESLADILQNVPAVRIAAIPTEYAGIVFRSRTEAKWASLFTDFGWHWIYEPFDLGGWSPDFQLEGRLLVEVRPYSFTEQWTMNQVEDGEVFPSRFEQIRRAMVQRGMKSEVLLCGAAILPPIPGYENPQIGWLMGPEDPRYDDWQIDNAMLYEYRGQWDLSAERGQWGSRLGRAVVQKWHQYAPDHNDVNRIVGNAANQTQWRPA